MSHSSKNKLIFLVLMSLFGCLGPLVKAIGLPSPVTAWLRACIASLTLLVILGIKRQENIFQKLKKNLLPLSVCGVLLCGDWIGLFEAYNYTTVATATVCYYITPILILFGACIFLKEKLSVRHFVCAVVAFTGMILISGVVENGFNIANIRGLLLSVFGAVCYAGIVLLNKRYPNEDALGSTFVQLFVASVFMTPYILLRYNLRTLSFSLKSVFLLFILGAFLTALAYCFYFEKITQIPSSTVSILSYADPVCAVLLSVFFLNENISLIALIGAILIIGSAMVSER